MSAHAVRLYEVLDVFPPGHLHQGRELFSALDSVVDLLGTRLVLGQHPLH